jgi:hypothetical protein
MRIEYIGAIAEEDYETFRIMLTTTIPSSHEMWLRVTERRKDRAFKERGAILDEVEITPEEFTAFCNRLKRPDFSIATFDHCAHEKALAQNIEPP